MEGQWRTHKHPHAPGGVGALHGHPGHSREQPAHVRLEGLRQVGHARRVHRRQTVPRRHLVHALQQRPRVQQRLRLLRARDANGSPLISDSVPLVDQGGVIICLPEAQNLGVATWAGLEAHLRTQGALTARWCGSATSLRLRIIRGPLPADEASSAFCSSSSVKPTSASASVSLGGPSAPSSSPGLPPAGPCAHTRPRTRNWPWVRHACEVEHTPAQREPAALLFIAAPIGHARPWWRRARAMSTCQGQRTALPASAPSPSRPRLAPLQPSRRHTSRQCHSAPTSGQASTRVHRWGHPALTLPAAPLRAVAARLEAPPGGRRGGSSAAAPAAAPPSAPPSAAAA